MLSKGLIIIMTLFPEDNIFGMNASLTYGPQFKKIIGDWESVIYVQNVQSRWCPSSRPAGCHINSENACKCTRLLLIKIIAVNRFTIIVRNLQSSHPESLFQYISLLYEINFLSFSEYPGFGQPDEPEWVYQPTSTPLPGPVWYPDHHPQCHPLPESGERGLLCCCARYGKVMVHYGINLYCIWI